MNPNIVTVNFNKGSFDSLVSASVKFWFGHLLTKVLTRTLCHESEASTVNYSKGECDVSRPHDHMYAMCVDSNSSSGNNCPICHKLCKDVEELSTFNERSIGCDGCNAWFHFGCIKITPKKLKEIGESNWSCTLCVKDK